MADSIGAFGSYIGAAIGGLGSALANQQNLHNQAINMQMANQNTFMGNSMLQGLVNPYSGLHDAMQAAQQYVTSSTPPVPQDLPKPKKVTEFFQATDDDEIEDALFAAPAWKRRLMKRYPEGMVIGGFLRRLALEIDVWHANAAGFPA